MTTEEYQQVQDALVGLAAVVRTLDLAGFLQRIERAEAAGPILAPSLYQLSSGRLRDVRRLATQVLALQAEVERQSTTVP